MFAARLQRQRRGKQRRFLHALRRNDIRHTRLAARDRAGLIQRDDLRFPGFFQRNRRFEQNSVLRAEAVADHDRHRCGKSQRAGTGNDQHGNAPRQRIAEGLADQQPHDQRHDGNGNDRRNEHAGHPVGDLCDGRLGRRRVADHLDDLRQRGILAHARRLAAQEARLVDRRSGNAVPRPLVRRDALAGQGRLIDRAAALEHDAVHRDVFARTHDKHVALAHLRNGDRDLPPVAHEARRLGRELHEALEGVGCLALGARLEHFADGDERQDHGCGFKIELVHIGHHAGHVAVHLRPRHGKQRIHAPHKRGHGAERDKRVHIGRAPPEALEAADKEFLIDHHDDARKQQLHQTHGDVVAVKPLRQRPIPHHMPHGEVHQHQQEDHGGDQPLFQLRRFVVGQRVLCGARGLRFRTLARCAVARVLHRADDRLRRGRSLHAHRIGQQAHRAGGDARHLGNRLFHTGAARRAAHARYIILFHIASPISSASVP